MKVILLGSGRNMTNINGWDTSGITVGGVNNTWKGTNKWDFMLHAGDYPFQNDIPKDRPRYTVRGDKNYKESYVEMTAAGGHPKLDWQKARIYLGLPIYFTISYWALYYLKPTHIGYLGFDMNYVPDSDGSTTFYGKGYDMQTRGVPDPIFQFKRFYTDLKDPMKTLLERLNARKEKTKLYNLSTDTNAVLPWQKISIDDFRNL